MPLTQDFQQTVRTRLQQDPALRADHLRQAIERMFAGDTEAGKARLRDYINATVGFPELARATGHSSKSLMRMFSPSGNPRARNLFAILAWLQHAEGLKLHIHAVREAA